MRSDITSFEIQVDDASRAISFYAHIFGWEFDELKVGDMTIVQILTHGITGRLIQRPLPVPASPAGTNAFVCSITVPDFDETAEKILQHGGRVALEKMSIPHVGWQGYFIDTEGNTFGILQRAVLS